ncbi:uncharacterized protein LOC131229510 isoform X2 [Magnolia sinica]|uniref:uncharacterized protein LOC131229510 isoform X2 n=1 Tax=Magnolia sinica TaxID=86752 RepID=UPI00265ABCE5|nr:uncharacterized protein LOC131229510 isoform X2 [Magnolia sinica]
MASSHTKPAPIRRLSDLLEEQQEPFLLDVYLLEKGYSKKIYNSDARNQSWIGDSCKKLLRLSREGINTSKLLKSALKNLIFDRNTSNCDRKPSGSGRFSLYSYDSDKDKKTQVMELDRVSSACSGRARSSCPDGNVIFSSAENFRPLELYNFKKQAAADRKLQWGCMEDCKQFSPVSVLEPPSDEGSPGHNHSNGENPYALNFNIHNEASEEAILSASLWDLLGDGSSQHLKSKRVLQQTKQLLFDCVREVIESHARKERSNECIGPEKLGKIVCDQIISWGKQGGNETNITQMLETDFSENGKQWKHFQPQIKEIGNGIGDAIFYEIRDEIVSDMLDLFVLERC